MPYLWVNDEKFMSSKTIFKFFLSLHIVTTKGLLVNMWVQKMNEFEISPGIGELKQSH